jgi:porin
MKVRFLDELLMAVVCTFGFIIAAPAGEISPLPPLTQASLASIWTYPTATGDWGGLRTRLAGEGITFNVQYAAEVWSNVTGGEKTGTVYTGLMNLQGNVDLQKLLGWQGASVSTRWYWLSGQDISMTNLGNNIFTVSNIAGFNTFRMSELWFQQNFLNNRISIRVGQLEADYQFGISTYDAVFLSGTFGWSPDIYTNIANGGPGYPMGAQGVQVVLTPFNWLTYQGAVFQGNVFPQDVNQHGFRWDLSASNGYFSIHELNFRINQDPGSSSLPGTFKIGGWFDTAPDPDATSTQAWNYGLYFMLDQMLYRASRAVSAPAADNTGKQTTAPSLTDKGLGIFTHIGLAPRNSSVINLYVESGLNYKGLIPTRDNDMLGAAFGYGHLHNNPQGNDGSTNPGYEIVFEATYQIVLTPWLSFQPDLQYVIQPASADTPNALVLGAHTTVSF